MKEHILQRRTTSSEDDPSFEAVISAGSNFERENSNSKKNNTTTSNTKKVSTSLALQIVDSDQDNTKSSCTSLTLAQEMASFEYIGKKHALKKYDRFALNFCYKNNE